MTGSVSRRLPMPDRGRLAEMLDYRDGALFWRERPRSHFTSDRNHAVWNGTWAGKRAGQMTANEYRLISIDKVRYLEHRLVYHLLRGPLQDALEIDHIDGNSLNNSIENLRTCSHAENNHNQKSRRPGLPKNVFWSKNEQKYKVQVRCNRKVHFVGTFADLQSATAAAAAARAELHGEFCNA